MTLEMAVAPIALAMANHPDLEDYDLSSLRYIMWGATPVSEKRGQGRHRAHRRALAAGLRRQRAAGHRRQPGRGPGQRGGSTRPGCPPAGVELRVADLDTGGVLAPGEVGEIQVRSPSVMAGYLPDEATADAFADGWYRTGDVGWLEPGGWVHLTDRSKEMIKVNGFQVAPAEIEAVLLGHPAVLDCAVFGMADERAGRGARGRRAARPGPARHRGELQQLVADSLATYKQLRHVVFVDSIPRLPSGKVLRRTLRDEWAPTLLASRGRRLMDVRLSPEQEALRDSAAQVVDRLGPGRWPSSTTSSGSPSWTPPSPRRAGASCGRRRTTGRPAGVGSGGGHRRRGARPGPGRRRLPRPHPGRRAAPAGRGRAGHGPRRSCSRPALGPLGHGRGGGLPGGAWPSTPGRHRRAGARRRPARAYGAGRGRAAGHAAVRVDLTRPTAGRRSAGAVGRCAGARRGPLTG